MTIIIDAVKMCEDKVVDFKERIVNLNDKLGYTPELIIINASDDPANERYIKGKVKQGEEVGLKVTVKKFEKDCTNESIVNLLRACSYAKVPVILQLPIFDHLDERLLLNEITPNIDADGFTAEWIGQVNLGNEKAVAPATPKGVMNLLDFHHVELEGKNALVIGRSNHVGKPLVSMLINRGVTVICANSKTNDLNSLISQCDIVISCVGRKDLIKSEYIKDGATVIGVGFTYENGKQILDFDLDDIVLKNKAGLVSNRINCTGKATINALIENVIKLYENRFK